MFRKAEDHLQLPGRYTDHGLCKSGLGVTISQKMVLKAFARDDVESRPLEPASHRTLGLAFSKTANSVVSGIMLEYLKKMTG